MLFYVETNDAANNKICHLAESNCRTSYSTVTRIGTKRFTTIMLTRPLALHKHCEDRRTEAGLLDNSGNRQCEIKQKAGCNGWTTKVPIIP